MFIVVTFDLKGADSEQYRCVEEALEKIGLRRSTFDSNGRESLLPENTFVAKYKSIPAEDAARRIYRAVEDILTACGLDGPIFVTAANEWAWRCRPRIPPNE